MIGNPIPAKPHHQTLPEIRFAGLSKKHSNGGHHQEDSKDVKNEMKPRHQSHAEQDHDAAHDKGAQDSPHQSAMLRHRRDLEISENDDENEDVIDAQRVFDHVASEKFEGLVRPAQFPH